MDWVNLLTSFEGRISRQPFWIFLIANIAIEVAAHFGFGERWSSIVSLLMAYPQFAVFAKRGHDRNVPTWVVGIFIAGAVIGDLFVLADLAGPSDAPSLPFMILAIPVAIMGLVLIVDFGFRRGTSGPNRFGPDPLAGEIPPSPP